MCGRYTLSPDRSDLQALLASLGPLSEPLPTVAARYNIAPTQRAWAVLKQAQAPLQLRPMAFGFRPKFMSHGVINARAETVMSKSLFRKAFAQSRCLVLASGFYEWLKTADGVRRPHHFSLVSGKPFVFAGLWRSTEQQDPGHGHHDAEFVIITTTANACVAPVHSRMPVMLPEEAARLWLNEHTELPLLEHLLAPYPSDRMAARAVSTQVNRPTVDNVTCIEPSPS